MTDPQNLKYRYSINTPYQKHRCTFINEKVKQIYLFFLEIQSQNRHATRQIQTTTVHKHSNRTQLLSTQQKTRNVFILFLLLLRSSVTIHYSYVTQIATSSRHFFFYHLLFLLSSKKNSFRSKIIRNKMRLLFFFFRGCSPPLLFERWLAAFDEDRYKLPGGWQSIISRCLVWLRGWGVIFHCRFAREEVPLRAKPGWRVGGFI